MRKHLFKYLAAVTALVLCLSLTSFAVSTEDAKEPVNISTPCSLTLTYKDGSHKLRDMEINLYRIADMSADFQYTFNTPYASCGLALNGLTSQTEWNTVLETVKSIIVSDAVPFDYQQMTDPYGQVHFTGLTPGIYLAKWTHNSTPETIYGFEPTLLNVPGLKTDGTGQWIYDVDALPKSGYTPSAPEPEKITYQVTKLWADADSDAVRPGSVEVVIYKNGSPDDIVTLSGSNDWTHKWETADASAEWTVAEKNVPEGYLVSLSRSEQTFYITNTAETSGDTPVDPDDPTPPIDPDDPQPPVDPDDPISPVDPDDGDGDGGDPNANIQPGDDDIGGGSDDGPNAPIGPKTGDTSNVYLYAVLMCASGFVLVILGIIGLKRRPE